MSHLHTLIKRQQDVLGGTVADWPGDFPLAFYIAANARSMTDGATDAVMDVVTGEEIDAGTYALLVTDNANGTFQMVAINGAFALPRAPESYSFIAFRLGAHPAPGQNLWELRFGANGFRLYVGNGVGQTYNTSTTVGDTASSANGYTGSAADQLDLIVRDVDAGTLSFYEGTNGETLLQTYTGVTGAIGSGNGISFLVNGAGAFRGMGLMIFPEGLPSNWPSVMTNIATALRADTDGAIGSVQKYTWIGKLLDWFENA